MRMFDDIPRPSDKELIVLQLLVAKTGQMYGLELVEASEGRLKRGTVYVTLDRMEDKGFIRSKKDSDAEAGAAARRLYKATGLGQRVLAAWEAATRSFAGGLT